jgi:hypothetical protein
MKQELITEAARLQKLAGILKEDEVDDLQSTVTASYEKFVNQLGSNASDPKIQALLKKGTEDGKPTDEVVSLKDASIPVQDLKPTQNEIALDKSLSFPLTNPKSTADCLKGGTVAIAGKRIITAKGQYIVDGHHRWSQLYAMNKDASIAVSDMNSKSVTEPMDFLKVTQIAIAADLGTVPTATAKGSKNLITIGEVDLKKYVRETITKDVMKVFVKFGKVKVKSNKDADNLSTSNLDQAANYIWSNVQSMQNTSKPVPGAPKRDVMPQTDDAKNWKKIAQSGELNYMPPFKQEESVNKRLDTMLTNTIIKVKK